MVYQWTNAILKNGKGKLISIYEIIIKKLKTNAIKNHKQYLETNSYCYQSTKS